MADTPGMSMNEAEAALLRADAAHEPITSAVLDHMVAGYRERYGLRPEVNAALHRLPPEQFARVSEGMKEALAACEAELADSTPIAFAEWVNDPAFEERWIEGVERNAAWALRTDNFYSTYHTLSSMFESALGGGAYAALLFDRALARVARLDRFGTSEVGALLRLMFRRVRFMALRGTARALDPVMPGEDLRFVSHAYDAVGKKEPLEGLSPEQIETLFEAWSALDWDGTLSLQTVFGREASPPPIETRPWAELVALVEKTSLDRLDSGERRLRTLSRLFGRPEPLADRIALAESLAVFAKAHGPKGYDAMGCVLAALVPHVAAAGLELRGALEAAAFRALSAGELQDVLLALPEPQVRGWVKKLGERKSEKQQKLAKTYAAALASRTGSSGQATSTGPEAVSARKPGKGQAKTKKPPSGSRPR